MSNPQNKLIINNIKLSKYSVITSGSLIIRENENCIFNIGDFVLEIKLINEVKSIESEIKIDTEKNKHVTVELINMNNPLGTCSSLPILIAHRDDNNKNIYLDFSTYKISPQNIFHYTFLQDI